MCSLLSHCLGGFFSERRALMWRFGPDNQTLRHLYRFRNEELEAEYRQDARRPGFDGRPVGHVQVVGGVQTTPPQPFMGGGAPSRSAMAAGGVP